MEEGVNHVKARQAYHYRMKSYRKEKITKSKPISIEEDVDRENLSEDDNDEEIKIDSDSEDFQDAIEAFESSEFDNTCSFDDEAKATLRQLLLEW